MRKKFTVFICALGLTYHLFAQSVAINADGSLPNSAAMLDIKSTTKGLLIPRMTTAQRNLLPNVLGLLVFDSDAGKFFFKNSTGWVDISTGANYWVATGTSIYNLNTAYVGIGMNNPLANLDVARGTSNLGTVMFRGTTFISHFNYSSAEDTYIRGGKNTSNVIISDVGNNVGIGVTDPAYKLDVGNRMRLRSQPGNITAGIWFNNYDNTAITGFIGEVGSGAPNHLGIYGNTSGWQLVMNTVSGNVGINTFNTTAGNGKLNVRNNIDGHAIKLIGNGQYISFYDEGNNPKGFIWNNGNDIMISTNAVNASGELQLFTGNAGGITIQSNGQIKAGALACTIPVVINGVPTLSRVSVQGALGFKKSFGDQVGEWSVHYDEGNDLLVSFNGGFKAFVHNTDGAWLTYSDHSLKEDFKVYKSVLRDIQKLPVLTYHYKSDKTNTRSFGLVAQDVQQYFPEIVSSKDPNHMLGIDYSKTGVLAIKAIQEQQVIIEDQQKKIEELEKRLARLEEKIR